MLIVEWPSVVAQFVEVWRLLDLSGMTKSVRESRNFTRAGYVYLNGNHITTLRHTARVGDFLVLEIRFPNGKVRSEEMRVVNRQIVRNPRQNTPTQINYRG